MKPQDKSRVDPIKPADIITDVGDTGKQTPGSDMQPDDAGTPESGNNPRGNAAEGALKQTRSTVNGSTYKR